MFFVLLLDLKGTRSRIYTSREQRHQMPHHIATRYVPPIRIQESAIEQAAV